MPWPFPDFEDRRATAREVRTGAKEARHAGGLSGPRHHAVGLLAALAPKGAFVEVDEVRRGLRDHDAHLLAASRADLREGCWSGCGVWFVGVRHDTLPS